MSVEDGDIQLAGDGVKTQIDIAAYVLPLDDVVIDMGQLDRLVGQTEAVLGADELVQHADIEVDVVPQNGSITDKLQYLFQRLIQLDAVRQIAGPNLVNLDRVATEAGRRLQFQIQPLTGEIGRAHV